MLKHTMMFAVVAGLVFAAAPAGAQLTYQWDAVAGGDAVVDDGSGTWQVGVGNWQDTTTPLVDQNWADGNDALFGGGSGGTAGTVTVSGTVTANYLTLDDPAAGSYTFTGGTIVADRVIKNGAATATLGGIVNLGTVGAGQQGWRIHNGGTLNITGNVTAADGNNGELTNNAGALNITGTFSSGGRDQILRGVTTLSGSGRWNLRGGGIYTVSNGGNDVAVLNIQDNAVLDIDRTVGDPGGWTLGSLMMGMGWGTCTGTVNQDGGTVNLPHFSPWLAGAGEGWGLCFGPGEWGRTNEVKGTYNLNAGTLNVSAIGPISSTGGYYALEKPEVGNPNSAAIFNFNGGLLKATQSDSIDPDAVAEGCNHLMFNMSHAYVQAGGAIIDVQGYNASMKQALEHDPALGGTPDGGLTKLGEGILTLLYWNTYTGDTTVNGGTLGIKHAYLKNTSSVSINSMMDLDFIGNDAITALTLGGAPQAPGIYNAGTHPAYFSGTGSLQVMPEPATMTLLALGGLAILRRRRRA